MRVLKEVLVLAVVVVVLAYAARQLEGMGAGRLDAGVLSLMQSLKDFLRADSEQKNPPKPAAPSEELLIRASSPRRVSRDIPVSRRSLAALSQNICQKALSFLGSFCRCPRRERFVCRCVVRTGFDLEDDGVRLKSDHRVIAPRHNVHTEPIGLRTQDHMLVDGAIVVEGDKQKLALQNDPGLRLRRVEMPVWPDIAARLDRVEHAVNRVTV